MTPAQLRVYQEVLAGPRGRIVGVLRAAMHSPELADLWQQFGAFLRYKTTVRPRLSELAILATARRWTSQVEWHVHADCARDAGLPEPIIDAIRNATSPEFDDPDEANVYEFARFLQETGQVPLPIYQQARAHLGDTGVVELTAIVGYYTLVSMTLNAHEISLVNGAPPPLDPVASTERHASGEPSNLTTLAPATVVDRTAVVKQ